MNSFLITLSLSLSVVYCNAAILDYSNIAPWKIAYAVYPVYEPESSWIDIWRKERSPESWVEVWKNERSWDIFNNAILNVRLNGHQKIDNNMNTKAADISHDSQKNTQSTKSEADKNLESEHSSANPWPRNHNEWLKSVKKAHPSI